MEDHLKALVTMISLRQTHAPVASDVLPSEDSAGASLP
jgi:hypothetical protein